jgi:phosphoserine phosphatase
MNHVLTLIAAKAKTQLTAETVSAVANALAAGGFVCAPANWLAEGEACDFPFEGEKTVAADLARGAIGDLAIDIGIAASAGRRKSLLVADMDSTMIGQECIDELAAEIGAGEIVAAITRKAMSGEIAFRPALRQRVALLKGLPAAAVDKVLSERITTDPRRPHTGPHHARQWRLCVSCLGRVYRLCRTDRQPTWLRRVSRQPARP